MKVLGIITTHIRSYYPRSREQISNDVLVIRRLLSQFGFSLPYRNHTEFTGVTVNVNV